MDLKRGFHRIGIVFAAPFVAMASYLLIEAVWSSLTSMYPGSLLEALSIATLSLAAGVFFYLAAWALGWIIRGFRGER